MIVEQGQNQRRKISLHGVGAPILIMTNNQSTSLKKDRFRRVTLDEWERSWRQHWSKVGQPGYELPAGGPGGKERQFLTTARTPDKERARLKRINDEFVRGFKGLFHVGPAVTV